MIVVDTNVVSEIAKPDPSRRLMDWFYDSAPQIALPTTVMAEILFGVEAMAEGKRKSQLRERYAALFDLVGARILSFDAHAAREFARVAARSRRKGVMLTPLDAQIAAVAAAGGAALATRNVADFEHTGLTIINPWTADT